MPNNIKSHIDRLNAVVEKLQAKAHKIQFDFNNGKTTPEVIDLIETSIKLKHLVQDLEHLNLSIDVAQDEIKHGRLEKEVLEARIKPRLERDLVAIDKKLKSALRVEKQAVALEQSTKLEKPKEPDKKKEEEEEKKPEKEKPAEKKQEPKPKIEKPPEEKKPKPSLPKPLAEEIIPGPTNEGDFKGILKRIEQAIDKFNKVIPGIQKDIYKDLQEELKRLDTTAGKIKPTVANLKIIVSIKNKMLRLILTPEYVAEVKDFVKAFNDVTKLQNEYWRSLEKEFKPRPLLREIKNQAIADTVKSLTASGIGSTIQEQIADILRTNITTGGSYADLNDQLRESLVNTKTDGLLLKYTKQITTDAINQYSAQYTQTVSNDLGFEWFAYQGSDIKTTRPFCDAMTDFRYFHVTEIPDLLAAKNLYYMKDGEKTKVPIYPKTGLPHGMIPGTNAANFQINRGGYNCGHQVRPVSASLVPADIKERVFATPEYKAYKSAA